MTAEVRAAAATLAALAVLGLFVALRFEVATDVTSFLPDAEERSLAALSREIADSELSRTMILTVGGPDEATAVAGGRALEAALRTDAAVAAELAFLEGGPPEGLEQAIWELYEPRRFAFGDGQALTSARLTEAAATLRTRLEQPMAPLISRVAPSDPLLTLPGLFDALEASRGGGVTLSDGRYVTEDRSHAVLFAGTHASAFDSQVQEPLLEAIAAHFAVVDAAHGGALTLESSAIARYAVRAEQAIRADIQRVSTLSILGLALLVFLLFRSPRLVGLTSIPIGAGVLAGCAATLLVFGRLHGITLAFGASLIGVAIDYVVHLYCHHAVHPSPRQGSRGGAHRSLDTIWRAVATGAATTGVGFVALGGSSFGGLREVAVFAVAGIAMALATTRWVVPLLMPDVPAPVPLRTRAVDALGRAYARLEGAGRGLVVVPLLAVGLFTVAVPLLEWNDDFASMQRLDPLLVAEDERVRARVAVFEQMRFVVALGDDDEAALQANDIAHARLAEAVAEGEVDAVRGIGTLLPSASKQRAAASVYYEEGVWERFVEAFDGAGFRATAFGPFREAIDGEPPSPVTWSELSGSPLAPLVRPFRVELGDQVAYLTFLSDVARPDALAERLANIDGALLLDQATLMREANRAYQARTLELMLIGLAAVLAFLGLRYRNPRRTLAAFAPALLGAMTTVAVLGLLGLGLDLVALTALLMVVSMGVDYGVFLVDAQAASPEEVPAALLSVLVACMSTVLGFGLLALSEHPVLFVIGTTAGVGVLSCAALAPTSLVLLGGGRADRQVGEA